MQKEDRCIYPVRTTIQHTIPLWTTKHTYGLLQFPQSQLKSIISLNTTWFSKLSLLYNARYTINNTL
jgi:hypothetical protein